MSYVSECRANIFGVNGTLCWYSCIRISVNAGLSRKHGVFCHHLTNIPDWQYPYDYVFDLHPIKCMSGDAPNLCHYSKFCIVCSFSFALLASWLFLFSPSHVASLGLQVPLFASSLGIPVIDFSFCKKQKLYENAALLDDRAPIGQQARSKFHLVFIFFLLEDKEAMWKKCLMQLGMCE